MFAPPMLDAAPPPPLLVRHRYISPALYRSFTPIAAKRRPADSYFSSFSLRIADYYDAAITRRRDAASRAADA